MEPPFPTLLDSDRFSLRQRGKPPEFLRKGEALTPRHFQAARDMRLGMKVRYFPRNVRDFGQQDPAAAAYFQAQLFTLLMQGELG